MEYVGKNVTDASSISDNRIIENLDVIFIILIVCFILVCIGVCLLVGKHKKLSSEEEQQHNLNNFDNTDLPVELNQPHFSHQRVNEADRNILRGSVSTPESPPPSYYSADRGQSFQSYISQTSSQFEIPPAYDNVSKERTSVTSSCIPEEEVEEVGMKRGNKKKSNVNRKSEPLGTAGEKKGKNSRRTKSDVTKKKKKLITQVVEEVEEPQQGRSLLTEDVDNKATTSKYHKKESLPFTSV